MNIQHILSTPNPDSKKFVLEEILLPNGVRQYDGKDMVKDDPLADALFSVDGVMSIFYMKNFLTVSKYPDVRWKDIEPLVVDILVKTEPPKFFGLESGSAAVELDNEMLQKIKTVIATRVQGALAADGGGLEVLGLEGKILTIRYQGACGGCPSATMGTLMSIQALLRQEVDPALLVVSA